MQKANYSCLDSKQVCVRESTNWRVKKSSTVGNYYLTISNDSCHVNCSKSIRILLTCSSRSQQSKHIAKHHTSNVQTNCESQQWQWINNGGKIYTAATVGATFVCLMCKYAEEKIAWSSASACFDFLLSIFCPFCIAHVYWTSISFLFSSERKARLKVPGLSHSA